MPVLTKATHRHLSTELKYRTEKLASLLQARELTSKTEGTKKGAWVHPERMCATEGSSAELKLAIADLKAILTEIQKLS